MTRGTPRKCDYGFLGEAPPVRWWQSLGDRELVNLEEPEVLALRTGGSLSMLLSGLPSVRRDVLGTRIRHTLVVDAVETDPGLAGRLAATALDPAGRERLGKELDRLLSAELVDAVLMGREDGAEIPESLGRMLESPGWAADHPGAAADRRGSWVAPLDSSDGRAAFVARIGRLAAEGREGYAFVTHSLVTVDGAERAAAELPGDGAILLADGDPSEVVALGKVQGAGSARQSSRPAARHPVMYKALPIVVILIAVVLTSILLL